jgi:CRISPR-associated protein Cas6
VVSNQSTANSAGVLTTPSFTEETGEVQPYVELSFRVFGEAIPVDHGYGLYSAISHSQPQLHLSETRVAIHSINGRVDKAKKLIRLNQESFLKVRISSSLISTVYPLTNQQLAIGKHPIRLGIPEIAFLNPHKELYSRISVIKGYQDVTTFLQAAQRQIDKLGIQGKPRIAVRKDGSVKRKTIKIGRYLITGFGLEIEDLPDEDSIKLQTYGLGGKQKMGCGIFLPMGRKDSAANS